MASPSRQARSEATRRSILEAARRRFAADGFERTTIRAVARDAQIDPSMVMRYYVSKQGLFTAAASLDLQLPNLSAVPRARLGEAAVRHFLSRWEGDGAGDSLRVLLATAVTSSLAAGQMQTIFGAQLEPVVAAAGDYGPEEAARRAGLVATQILGLALCRYVLRLPPVVALEADALVAWLAPVVHRYLTEPSG